MNEDNIAQLLEATSSKYNELVKLQDTIRRDPKKLKILKLEDSEMLNDFKEERLDKEYNKLKLYTKKYKSTVDVLNKVKDFVNKFDNQIIVDFELDKEDHSTVAIAGYDGPENEGKVYLWKGTYEKPDYIKFNITPSGECKITKIFSQEQGLGHKSFMFNTLKKALHEHNTSVVNNKYDSMINEKPVLKKIVAELSENTSEEIKSYHRFFIKNGFELGSHGIYKLM